jgi:hypothetical protein
MFRQAFSLAEELLKRLGQRDRRGGQRYCPGRHGPCLAIVHHGERAWPAEVDNISEEGIRLEIPEALPPGTEVEVDLSNKCGLFAKTLRVRVLHLHASAAGFPVFGGAFTEERLTTQDLCALLTVTQFR